MRLVVALGQKCLTRDELAPIWPDPGELDDLLARAYQHQIIDREFRDGVSRYRVSCFYDRLDNFAKFGNYHVVPRKVRQQLDEWCFTEYLKRNDSFQQVFSETAESAKCHNEWILLLSEVEAMIDRVTVVRVVPCNCKMLADRCGHSREICLILDRSQVNDRTGGRDLTGAEAKNLVRRLDREGLIHTGGPPDWAEAGPGVVCNCCTCCCYPFRAARQLGTKGKWPKSRYVACYEPARCRSCGLCTRRCPFGAFSLAKAEKAAGQNRREIRFNPELCWGCGICANNCPGGAITMVKI